MVLRIRRSCSVGSASSTSAGLPEPCVRRTANPDPRHLVLSAVWWVHGPTDGQHGPPTIPESTCASSSPAPAATSAPLWSAGSRAKATTSSASPAERRRQPTRRPSSGSPPTSPTTAPCRCCGTRSPGADAVVHLAWGFQPSHDLAHLEGAGSRRHAQGPRGGHGRLGPAPGAHVLARRLLAAAGRPPGGRDLGRGTACRPRRTASTRRRAERLLDAPRAGRRLALTITRIRPGIIGQRTGRRALCCATASQPWCRPRCSTWCRCCPLDRGLKIPMVHADDVADAVERVLVRSASEAPSTSRPSPPVTTDRHRRGPRRAARCTCPLVSCAQGHGSGVARPARSRSTPAGSTSVSPHRCWTPTRASRELGWSPSVDGVSVFREIVAGMFDGAWNTPVLRRRSVMGSLRDVVRRGPVSVRHRP